MKKVFFTVTLLLLSVLLWSQEDNIPIDSYKERSPRFFHSFGMSIFSEYISGITTTVPFYDTLSSPTQVYSPERFSDYSLQSLNVASFTYVLRYTLKFFDIDHSLSISSPMTLGLSYLQANDGSGAYGSFSVPLMLQYHSGVAASFDTQKWKGWMVGLGAELMVFPVVSSEQFKPKLSPIAGEVIMGKHKWIQGAAEVSYRWISTYDKCQEINLKVGCGLPQKWTNFEGNKSSNVPFSVKLAYIFSINY
ncbi:MAG: hypothetical protein RBS19_05965 [Bacteroidales bacterium]|nr:hypothetical protein [Bacteroidales bacterium]MDY0216482.1 hypothetical protein [Bacteroidales bacterium]